MTPEKTRLKLGIVRLTDCAPLVVAKERGFFAAEGLEVELSREPSWANIRDKVALAALDGAQMLGPMPLAATARLDALAVPMVTALALSLNGNAVTVSNAVYDRLAEIDPVAAAQRPVPPAALKRLVEAEKRAGRRLTFAVVYPFSTHGLELRYWMAAGGIDPERDVRLVVVPPPQMVSAMTAGTIDGFCVGAPWNSQAVSLGLGRVLVTSQDIWPGRIEKVFGVTAAWAAAHPNTHRAVLRAVLDAARWADAAENRLEVAEILAQPEYLNLPLDVVAASLTGAFPCGRDETARHLPDFHVFFRYAATFPWRSQAEWYLEQLRRWHLAPHSLDVRAAADAVFRPDLYREAAADIGIAVPQHDRKDEGRHKAPWLLEAASSPIAMCRDTFLDDAVFDPPPALTSLSA